MADPREEGARRRYKKKQPSWCSRHRRRRRARAGGGTITHGEGQRTQGQQQRRRGRKGRQRKTKGSAVPQWPLEGAPGLESSAKAAVPSLLDGIGAPSRQGSHRTATPTPAIMHALTFRSPLICWNPFSWSCCLASRASLGFGTNSFIIQRGLTWRRGPGSRLRSMSHHLTRQQPHHQSHSLPRPAPSMSLEQMLDTDRR